MSLPPSSPLASLRADHGNLPDRTGEGMLFAFSGLDGPTSAASGFVLAMDATPFHLLVHTPRRRRLRVRLPGSIATAIATGDVLAADAAGGPALLTFSAWHTVLGALPADGEAILAEEDGTPSPGADAGQVSVDAGRDALALVVRGERFALAWGATAAEATERAVAGCAIDPWREAAARLAPYRSLPSLPRRGRLLGKCLSVMRVNALAAEGIYQQRWSTPDRVPHHQCWLWDSVFHSLAMNRVDARAAWEYLRSVLITQRRDGMIPHRSWHDGTVSEITQPPILAWGVIENFRVLGDRTALAWALPRLEAYLEWDLRHRDRNRNGLLEWFIEGSPRCRSGESGLDNSPRFDAAVSLDAVDFSVFAALEMEALAQISETLGRLNHAQHWRERSQQLSATIHAQLWNHDHDFYEDRDFSGVFTGVRAVSGFLPLLLPDCPTERVAALVAALNDPAHFAAAVPVPSVSLSSPSFGTDMWRGPMWVNLNYLIMHGLARRGRRAEAVGLAEATVAEVERWYDRYGVTFEYFDAHGRVPPPRLDRKGPTAEIYDCRAKISAIRDYHWTAALTFCVLQEDWLAERS